MKKIFLTISVVAVISLLASCSGPKADANKLCKKACACQRVEDPEKSDQCVEELLDMAFEMMEKYKDDPEAEKVFDETGEKCKCLQNL